MKRSFNVIVGTSAFLLVVIALVSWANLLSADSPVVVYFGTPRDAIDYALSNSRELAVSAASTAAWIFESMLRRTLLP